MPSTRSHAGVCAIRAGRSRTSIFLLPDIVAIPHLLHSTSASTSSASFQPHASTDAAWTTVHQNQYRLVIPHCWNITPTMLSIPEAQRLHKLRRQSGRWQLLRPVSSTRPTASLMCEWQLVLSSLGKATLASGMSSKWNQAFGMPSWVPFPSTALVKMFLRTAFQTALDSLSASTASDESHSRAQNSSSLPKNSSFLSPTAILTTTQDQPTSARNKSSLLFSFD